MEEVEVVQDKDKGNTVAEVDKEEVADIPRMVDMVDRS